jgi:hypothetical protein
VVDGIQNVQPAVSGMQERILVIRDQPTLQQLAESSPPVDSNVEVPNLDLTLNYAPGDAFTNAQTGVTTFTPSILPMQAGVPQFWRICNCTSDTSEHDMAKARLMLIHAAVAEPYNRIVWRELHAWSALNGTQINFVYVGIPREPRAPGIDARHRNALSAAWDAYYAVRDQWQNGGEFKRRFPEDKQYLHSLPEESEALTAAIKVLEKLEADGKSARQVDSDTGLVLLLKLHEAGLIEPYVLFSLGDPGIARDYIAYRGRNRERLEEYMDKFVVPLPR